MTGDNVALERITLGRDPAEVGRARRHVARACAGMSSDLVSIAQLLTSELVTNALKHGRGDILLHVVDEKSQIRVEVSDEARGTPTRGVVDGRDESGRGLMLVERLSAAWGVRADRGRGGKTVWFTLRTR